MGGGYTEITRHDKRVNTPEQRRRQSLAVAVALALMATLALFTTPALAAGNVSIIRTFQDSASYTGTSDSFMKKDSATSNYGNASYMEILPGTGNLVHRMLVKFDISSIPTGSSVSSATLSLYHYYTDDTESTTRTHNAHRITQNWTEGTGTSGSGVDWNRYNGVSSWTTAGGDFDASATGSWTVTGTTYGSKSCTVTTDVSAFVGGTASNYGWLVKDSESTQEAYKRMYRTSEYSTASQRPKLSVTFTAPWDSYESDYTTGRETYTGSYNTVYMKGTGFQDISYLIAYYDADGVKTGSETVSAPGGTLNGAYLLTSDQTAAPGTWHALVQPSSGYTGFGTGSYDTIVASPDTYGLLANDSFTVEASATPEFPTVIAGVAVAGLCAVIYWRMRRTGLAYVKA